MCIRDRSTWEEMNTVSTKTKISADWSNSYEEINPLMAKVTELLSKVDTLGDIFLSFNGSKLDDAGCKAVGQLLLVTPTIFRLVLYMDRTKLTDLGIMSITNKLPLLNLQEVILAFRRTQVTDHGIISLSHSLRQVSSQVTYFALALEKTKVTDAGVLPLIDSLWNLTTLTRLYLDFDDCEKVTDATADKLVHFLSARRSIEFVNLSLKRMGMSEFGISRIREIQSRNSFKIEC
eukprot:TRINITY_DN16114_c0_g1_i1.p1 TRINITY_DN16114_c0_g1~~TRINITY_DN16114_c0_g1_i1.p1  ORF type:complete len:234 (+),score=33.73 TRINITY_DN16114_c0_g1_i1:60-761(+)